MSSSLHLSLHFTHTPQHTHAFQRISIRIQFVPYLLINGNLALSQNLIHPVTETHRSQKSHIAMECPAPVLWHQDKMDVSKTHYTQHA